MSPFTKLMWDQSRWSFRADAVYASVAQRLASSKEPFDLLAVYIGGTDVASHRFWRYAHPEDFFSPPPAQEIADFGHVIDDYYIHLDRVIAALLAASPAGTSVVIASDHGFHTVNPRGTFSVDDAPDQWNSGNHLDAPSGVFIAAGPGFVDATPGDSLALPFARSSLHDVGDVYDVLPTLLALKDIPVAQDFDGTVMERCDREVVAGTLPRAYDQDARRQGVRGSARGAHERSGGPSRATRAAQVARLYPLTLLQKHELARADYFNNTIL